jgi:hypothetical protein
MDGEPRIALRDDLAEHQRLYLDPCNLTEREAETVAQAIHAALDAARSTGDGCRVTWSDVKRRRSRAMPEGDTT